MLRAILQTMLAERCKVMVHRESKDVPVYDLVEAKGGPKFKQAETVDATELEQKHQGGGRVTGGGMAVQGPNGTQFTASRWRCWADGAIERCGQTGGGQDGPDRALPPFATIAGSTAAAGASPADDESIFTTLPEALGLRLQPAKGRWRCW